MHKLTLFSHPFEEKIMPDAIGAAGNASQSISVPPPTRTQTAAETQSTENTETANTETDNDVAQTQQVNANSSVGSNIDTTA
jgi:hypothetical protein